MKENLHLLGVLAVLAIMPNIVQPQDYGNDYGIPELEERPLPPELAQDILEKTDYEKTLEGCMLDFVQCERSLDDTAKSTEVCGSNRNYEHIRQTFVNICHMIYKSCKSIEYNYLNDGPCGDIPKNRKELRESEAREKYTLPVPKEQGQIFG